MAKKILIIEDTSVDAKMVKGILENEGFRVDVAMTGKEGLTKAREIVPDLVLLDLILPDMNGFDVCEEIKKDTILSNTIVVVLSIKDDINDITKAFHVGADDYIIKTPLPEFLARKVKLYLGA